MKILILGAGAIGSNLALNLSHDTNKEIAVLDDDKIEPRNYQAGTQLYTREQVGKYKVDALALNIFIATGKRINPLNLHFGEGERFVKEGEYNLLVDCFDNHESRQLIAYYCKDHQISCLHVGFSDQFTFSIEWNKDYKAQTDIHGFDICDADGASSFVKFVAGIASLNIQHYLKTNEKLDLIGNFKSVTTVI